MSAVNQPQLRVLVNGSPCLGAIEAEVTTTSRRAAGHFHVRIAVGVDPALTPAWWSNTVPIPVEVDFATSPGGFVPMITGQVDRVDYDPAAQLIEIEGRDAVGTLLDTKIQQTYANQTSSQIAQMIASEHGLEANITPTTTPVGQFYQLEHDVTRLGNFSRATTEWDLLTFLADHEGYQLFVSGNTLYFNPQVDGSGQPALVITYQPTSPASFYPVVNAEHIKLDRSLTLAKDVKVTVRSWNSRQKSPITASDPATSSSGRGGLVQNYVFVRPNLDQASALKLAQYLRQEITKHERIMTVEMPGETTLLPSSVVQLVGTGTSWDQTYFVDEIHRRMGPEGFHETVRLKNSSPQTEGAGAALP